MAGRKAKRVPRGKASASPKSKQVKSTRIHKDPEKEFAKALSKKGMVKVLRMADDDCLLHVKDYQDTGNPELDRLLGGRGIPFGRITEIFGPHHIGKSTILDQLFAQVQKAKGTAVLADTEEARDIRYTAQIGVDPDRLLILDFDRAELTMENVLTKVLETIEWWHTNYPEQKVLIGWDSLGGTQTAEERDKAVERGKSPGSAASIMQLMRRKVTPVLAHTNIGLIILNHEYEKINTSAFAGKKRETYGGEAVRMAASIRLELHPTKGQWFAGADGSIVGRKIGVKLVKSKLGGSTMDTCELLLLHGHGISNAWSLYEALRKQGIIQTSGSWSAINLDGQVLNFQGFNGLAKLCADDETLEARLIKVYDSLGAKVE
jgi:recombination protein RecA